MPHVLVVTDARGRVLAEVRVEAGYRIREVAAASGDRKTPDSQASDKSEGDSGKGAERVG